jgi:chemosensory pili system protein ChpA (sensor histidine kinase/response regulator)
MLIEGSNASTVLTWVRPDLDKHLNQVRAQIEHLAQSTIVGDGVEHTAEHLLQLKFTFEALVLQGATLVVEEMVTVCEELKQDNVRDRRKAFGSMMDAIVVLPSYLDRLQAGHHDLPILLLPVINDLRSAYDANIVSEATLFTPSLDVPLPELEQKPGEHEAAYDESVQEFALRMRRQWENALLKWLRAQDNTKLLQPLYAVCESLQHRLERMDLRRLWWIASKVIGGLLDGVTENDMHLRRLFARLHLIIKTLSEGGEEATDIQSVDAVSQALLFHIAQAKSGSESVDDLRERFQLQDLIPDRDVLIRARGAVTGRNRELYVSLGAAVRDELSLVKDALDLELRTGEIEPERREHSHEALLRLKDTLKMMGLGESAQSIAKLMPAFDASKSPDDSEEQNSRKSLLMGLAGELIRVESDLEEQIATLGEPLQDDQGSSFIDLPPHEIRRIRAHLLDETVFSLHQVQDGVRQHFAGDQNANFTDPMEHIAGALELIGEADTASLALKLRNALENLLRLARSEAAVDADKLELVTDAVAAFELYLAGCRDQQLNRGRFLDILKDRLERLPVGEMEMVKTSPQTETRLADDHGEQSVLSGSPLPTKVDPELLGVFLEEYRSVSVMLHERIPLWLQTRGNSQLMTEIRRGFHTIKGSGRMVGAYELGDFAWHIESMLNALLEGTIDAVDEVALQIQLSAAALPALKKRLLQETSELNTAAIKAISEHAKSLSEGKQPDWATLGSSLPASFGVISNGVFVAATQEPETLQELICKELSENLTLLRALMERVSRDRSTTANADEIRAVHTIAGTTELQPLGKESKIAKALEGFLTAQSRSKKAFSNSAIWTVATGLGHLETCLTIHDGDGSIELADNEDSQIEQIIALTTEYEPRIPAPVETVEIKEEIQAEEEAETQLEDEAIDETEQEPIDPEILSIFLEEANDILERCDSLLNSWRDDLLELRIVQNLQREIHTFKGGSRMSGLTVMGTLSHTMESLLESIAGQLVQPSDKVIDVLEQGCDRLNTWVEEVSRGEIPKANKVLEEYASQINALTGETEPVTAVADEVAASAGDQVVVTEDTEPVAKSEVKTVEPEHDAEEPATEPEEAEGISAQTSSETEVTQDEPAPEVDKALVDEAKAPPKPKKPEPILAAIPAPPKIPVKLKPPVEELREIPDAAVADSSTGKTAETAASQHIRVNADLLDSLVNSAGEISIFRSLLEQQVVHMRDHLKEFDVTTARLREQFRKLEIETETQIGSRLQQEVPEGSEEFDPLEMDRFSSLHQLSRSLSESVSDLLNLQELLDETARKSEALLVQQSRVSNDLQDGLMQTRMVHFGTIAPRLRRIIRIASKETRKKARLHLRMTGGGDQLDRNVLERITAPLEHLLRNSIAHGIEKPPIRQKLKKPVEGQLSITVASEATEFIIRVEDDGAGIDLKAIHKRAVETGLIDKNAKPAPQQLLQLILNSGFSTSKTVTALSGRGVGMDVVSSEIKQIGGSVEIDSEEGKGSCFTIRIPFTLAVMQAIGVIVGEHRYLIPVASVAGVTRMLPADYQDLLKQEEPAYEFAGEAYSILELEPLLGEPGTPLGDETISMLMIKSGEQKAAFRVSELLGHREIVVKPIGPQINSVPGILGGTVTGDGKVVVIIDAGPLIRQALLTGARPAPAMARVDTHRHKTLAMVVDDSITMRRVTTRVLENNDYDVITARDGVDATEQMQDRIPDVLLLDVEMPRMDGYQVAEHVRADARLRHIPIVMITSRAGIKHRERGIKAGANAYLSKPYKESELIKEVEKLLADKEQK